MIRPGVLQSDEPHGPWSCRGTDVWDTLQAALNGDVDALRNLLARDANLYRAEYWSTQPIHLAVREGQLDVVRLLLDAGADPGATSRGSEGASPGPRTGPNASPCTCQSD